MNSRLWEEVNEWMKGSYSVDEGARSERKG